MDYLGIDITYPLKFAWRVWQSIRLRKRDIRISPQARWNGQTLLGGHNTVSSDVCIGHTRVGRFTYIRQDCDLAFCEVGSFCSIASGVRVVRFRHPADTFVSTSPAFFSTVGQCGKTFVRENRFEEQRLIDGRSAIIGNDVWIGRGCNLKCTNPTKPLVIGDGAVIASDSVVVKNVPPYAIVGGNPAQIIKYRFPPDVIEALLRIKWWDWSLDKIHDNFKYFNNIDKFISLHDRS